MRAGRGFLWPGWPVLPKMQEQLSAMHGLRGPMKRLMRDFLCCGALGIAPLLCVGAQPAPDARADHPLTLDTHVDIPFGYMREPRFDVGADTKLKVDLGK